MVSVFVYFFLVVRFYIDLESKKPLVSPENFGSLCQKFEGDVKSVEDTWCMYVDVTSVSSSICTWSNFGSSPLNAGLHSCS